MTRNPLNAPEAIERLRQYRTRTEFDDSIGRIVRQAADQARTTERRLGELIALWNAHVPTPLANQSRLVTLGRGVLTVEVDNAAARYELDRLLREGLLDRLRSAYKGSLQRVRLTIAREHP